MDLVKTGKIVAGVFATIILGAIGSGVWERLLSPGLASLGSWLSSFLSSISTSYSNSIYETASTMGLFDRSGAVGIVFLLIALIMLFFNAIKSKADVSIINTIRLTVKRNFTGWQGIILTGSLVVFTLFTITKSVASQEIKKYAVKNLEILRPYIGENEYHLYKSDYLRIKTKEDFNQFLERLYNSSKKAGVKIEEFK